MESHIEDVGDIIDTIFLLFLEFNTSSFSIVIGLAQQGTPSLPAPTLMDDFLTYILGLWVESHIVDLGDIINDLYLLFVEEDPSQVVVRAPSNHLVHSLHDQSSHIDVIVDPYVQ